MKKKNYFIIALIMFLIAGLIIGGLYVYRQSNNQQENDKEVNMVDIEVLEPSESEVTGIQQAFMEKYQKNDNEVQITIQKLEDNYARGGVKFATAGQAGEGGIFLAYKDDGIWKLAFDGNGMISCSEMAKYDFPADMALDCYNETIEAVNPSTQLANPAAINCLDKGGQSEIRTAEDGGQYGVCKFSDGSECEEWAFFRDECKHIE